MLFYSKVDDVSRYCVLYLLSSKSKATDKISDADSARQDSQSHSCRWCGRISLCLLEEVPVGKGDTVSAVGSVQFLSKPSLSTAAVSPRSICDQCSETLAGCMDRIVSRFGHQDAKASKSSMDTGFTSIIDSSAPFPDNTQYGNLVVALLYVAVSARHDMTVRTFILGRKVRAPTIADWTSVKSVLRFLNATKH